MGTYCIYFKSTFSLFVDWNLFCSGFVVMHGLGAAQQHFQIIRSVSGLINSHANMSSAKLTVFLFIILVISGNSYNFTLIFNGLKMGKVFKSKT